VAEIKVRMGIDPFSVVGKALAGAKKIKVSRRIVSIDYDEEADILYVKFKHARIVDNESLDDEGLVVASLDEQGKVAGLMVMEASRFAEAS
jgi:uncharacterized protein YuzE